VASQGLPVAFYAEMRGRKQDQAVKVELNKDRMRLIFLSSYDKKGNAAPPRKPAGEDGLGDMVVDPSVPREQQFDSLDVTLSEIKKVETDKGILKLKTCEAGINAVSDLPACLHADRGTAGAQVREHVYAAVRALSGPGRFQAVETKSPGDNFDGSRGAYFATAQRLRLNNWKQRRARRSGLPQAS